VLLSAMPKRTCVDFRNFTNSVLAKRFAKRTCVDFRNLANSVLAQRLAKTNLSRLQKFCRFFSCSAFGLNALLLKSDI